MDAQKPLLGIFTPTYNRAHTLTRCYESLLAQTSKNFQWYIVDDGSTDDTRQLVDSWKEQGFSITYLHKENGGLHTGYNHAIANMDNPLCLCLDSDDWLPPDAVEIVERLWNGIKDLGYVGIMGLDCLADGSVVGARFPEDVREMYLYEKLVRYQIPGDKKMAYRTDILKQLAPMPVYPGEKNFNPSYLMYQADRFGKLYVTNECLCIVEYQPDGMSSAMLRQYKNSPNSFAAIRRQYLSFPGTTLSFRLRHSIHLTSSCILAGRPLTAFRGVPNPWLSLLAFPLGAALALYIRFRA